MRYVDEFKDVKIISLDENSRRDAENDGVEIYCSDRLLFDLRSEYHFPNDHTLLLMNYSGGIGLPKNVALETRSDFFSNITGYLASPAYIQGCGDLSLVVDPALELIIRNAEPTKLDGLMLRPDDEDFSDYCHGRDFASVKREYYDACIFPKPKIFVGEKSVYASFQGSVMDCPEIILCKEKNIVFVHKWEGISNIYHASDIPREHVGKDETGLRAQLEKAISEERYEDAKRLQTRLNKVLRRQGKNSEEK